MITLKTEGSDLNVSGWTRSAVYINKLTAYFASLSSFNGCRPASVNAIWALATSKQL